MSLPSTVCFYRVTTLTFFKTCCRVKEVDWIPYLTQRLVDDAASHLRLYKQARTKMKIQEHAKEQKNSPSRENKSPKKNVHKRNKSETDVTWYTGRTTELKRGNHVFVSI